MFQVLSRLGEYLNESFPIPGEVPGIVLLSDWFWA